MWSSPHRRGGSTTKASCLSTKSHQCWNSKLLGSRELEISSMVYSTITKANLFKILVVPEMFPFLTWSHGVKSSVRRELVWLKMCRLSLVSLDTWTSTIPLSLRSFVQWHIYVSGDADCNCQTGSKAKIRIFTDTWRSLVRHQSSEAGHIFLDWAGCSDDLHLTRCFLKP